MPDKKSQRSLLAAIGPGIIWASTSIGVSHVVQSTRAGADFGFALISLIIIANLIKYPFFQIGPRYAAATGESLLDGYQKVGSWAFILYLVVTAFTMFFVQAGVTIVASGLLANLIGDSLTVDILAAMVSSSIVLILLLGRYALLDKTLKLMMLVFALVTIFTVITALLSEKANSSTGFNFEPISLTSAASIAFIVALVGWMPTSIEVSVWHSLWTISRRKQTDHRPSVREAMIDFNFGFIFCMLFAILFLVLGATLIYGKGITFSSSPVGFTSQLIGLYVDTLGGWSWGIIALVTFIAMYSTCLAVADGFSEVWARSVQLIKPGVSENLTYFVILLTLSFGGWMIIKYFGSNLKQLIDFATTVSFVSAPIFAYLNLKAMSLEHVPVAAKLSNRMQIYSWACFSLLTTFAVFYLFWRFA